MDNTPQSFQNSTDSGCYESSHFFFESTPTREYKSTVSLCPSRKRKTSYFDTYDDKKLEGLEACPPTPPFCSTLNDSLSNDLENFHLQTESKAAKQQKSLSKKRFKVGETSKKFNSVPNTPERQIKCSKDAANASTSSFIKNFSQINVNQSPLNKEAYSILYPDLPSLEPVKKPLTPQKFKENLEKSITQAKKCLFTTSRRELLKKIFSNYIIMNKIFKHLSDGDLYRLSMVSKSLKDAVMLDVEASNRFISFRKFHYNFKENYRITPPSSPEKDDSYGDATPGSKNFYYFYSIANELNKNQSLIKCPRCSKASVVENFIGQCQDVNCGYIFCQKCNSFASNPRDFKDKCNNAQLVNINKPRILLSDLSNSTVTSDYVTDTSNSFFTSSSLILNFSNKYDSSGVFSETDNNTPLRNVNTVKRNLSESFTMHTKAKVKVLSSNNQVETTQSHKYQRRTSLVPVFQSENTKTTQIMEPSSPPKVKQHSACSKQSKRNLKRLTR